MQSYIWMYMYANDPSVSPLVCRSVSVSLSLSLCLFLTLSLLRSDLHRHVHGLIHSALAIEVCVLGKSVMGLWEPGVGKYRSPANHDKSVLHPRLTLLPRLLSMARTKHEGMENSSLYSQESSRMLRRATALILQAATIAARANTRPSPNFTFHPRNDVKVASGIFDGATWEGTQDSRVGMCAVILDLWRLDKKHSQYPTLCPNTGLRASR